MPLDRDTVPPNLPEPRLRLRSQLSLELAARGRLAPEAVIALKHSPRMLMAERVVDDLLAAGQEALDRSLADDRGQVPVPEAAALSEAEAQSRMTEALNVLATWNRTASADSRGAVLFQRWAGEYFAGAPDSLRWRQPWDPERPATTPFGLRDPAAAVGALSAAADSLAEQGIPLDVQWGEIHRVIRGGVDVPVSGCPPTLGCFRALSFGPADGDASYPRLAANRGDAWVLIVEFGEVPTAYTVLSYGQTARSESPHYSDQAAMFARGEMKRIAWTTDEIESAAIRRYRPGREARR